MKDVDFIGLEALSKDEVVVMFKSFAEYEANKKCGNCRRYEESPQEGIKECYAGIEISTGEDLPSDFGCILWESKNDI